MAGEFERIAEIQRRLACASADIELGIGDDAALLRASARAQALSVDTQVEGVHFSRAYSPFPDMGYRALAAAVSDLGAMAARPRAALCALILPATIDDAALYAIVDGIAEAARDFGCPVAGGNLAAGGELSITTTVVGDAPAEALTRAGARAGHALFVTGELGASALGLAALQAGRPEVAPGCVARYRRPRARVREGQALAGIASAAIDVSDGLLQDLGHLAGASGVGFELELARLPLHPELSAGCQALGLDPEALALAGGEDYELLFTAAQEDPPPGSTRIGRAVPDQGIRLRAADGRLVPAPTGAGFEHFRPDRG